MVDNILKKFISLVFPGVFEVLASFLLLESLFIKLDFPTLERPRRANSGRLKVGHCDNFSALIIKFPDTYFAILFPRI